MKYLYSFTIIYAFCYVPYAIKHDRLDVIGLALIIATLAADGLDRELLK